MDCSYLSIIGDKHALAGKRYIPLVTKEMNLHCSLDVVLLRRTEPQKIYSEGDLDGKIKTLMDALKKPELNDAKNGDEDPLYCLVEDDNLITELKLVGDLLLPTEDQLIAPPTCRDEDHSDRAMLGQQHALALIHVKVRVNRTTEYNTDFL
jgi:hypothetical protein